MGVLKQGLRCDYDRLQDQADGHIKIRQILRRHKELIDVQEFADRHEMACRAICGKEPSAKRQSSVFAPKCSANSFGFTSWPQFRSRSSHPAPSIVLRGGLALIPSGMRSPETASDRQRRDSIRVAQQKTVGHVQAAY